MDCNTEEFKAFANRSIVPIWIYIIIFFSGSAMYLYCNRELIMIDRKQLDSLPERQQKAIKNLDERFGFYFLDKPKEYYLLDF